MLAGKLPPTETFELGIPVKAMQGLRTKDLQRVQWSLAAWVEATAPTLPLAPYGRYVVPIQSVQLAMTAGTYPQCERQVPPPERETAEWLGENATEFCAALNLYIGHARSTNREQH
jgi:hypothetical protein